MNKNEKEKMFADYQKDVRRVIADSVLVGADFSNGKDVGVLVVGRKRMNQAVEIINTFQGDEAWELYNKLITPKKKE